jgi:hypothetical protein
MLHSTYVLSACLHITLKRNIKRRLLNYCQIRTPQGRATTGCLVNFVSWGTRWRSWLRHCATSRTVRDSISGGVSGIFHWNNPPGRTMGLGSTQHVKKIGTKNILWGIKGPDAWGWQPYRLHVQILWKSGAFNLLEPLEPVQACTGITVHLSLWITTGSYDCHLHSALQEINTELFWLSSVSGYKN